MAYPRIVFSDDSRPDPHGLAAMLLVESLIHELIAKRVITVREAVEVVDTALEVAAEIGTELGDMSENVETSTAVLKAVSTSLSNDLPSD